MLDISGFNNILRNHKHQAMSRKTITRLCIIFPFMLSHLLWAEGTKQLRPTATDSTSIQILKGTDSGSDFATYNGPVDYRLNIRVCEVGEVICLGFQKKTKHAFRLIDPTGDSVITTTSLNYASTVDNGYILNYAQAVAGPNIVNAAGYKPILYTATKTGDYHLEFKVTDVLTNPERYIGLFDVTVLRNNVVQDGRLWSKSWLINVQSSSNTINAKMFVYTSDQIVSRLEFNGAKPFEFNISCNSTGVKKTGITDDDRKSVYNNFTYPEFPIFLNDPDIKCFPTGVFGDIVGTPTFSGCGAGSCIYVQVNKAGNIQVLMDLDGVAGFQANGADIILSKTVTAAGLHCVPWDGKDGNGNVVAYNQVLNMKISFLSGLTHLPLYDVEQNPNGFKVFYVRPASPSAQTQIPLFWDDSDITASAGIDTKVNIATGCVDAAGCHKWTGRGANGNEETINTWWAAETKSVGITYNYINVDIDANKLKPGKGASNDDTYCGDGSAYQLNAKVVKATGVKWTSSGTGTFSLDSDTNASYTPSVADINAGSVKLKIASTGNGNCPTVYDSLLLTFTKALVLNQGIDTVVCQNNPSIQLYAVGANFATVTWSGGTGTFSDIHSLTPTYTPSATELGLTSFTLTLSATPASNICSAASKNLKITVLKTPVVDAGTNAIICSDNSLINITGTSSTGTGLWSGGTVSHFQSSLATLTNQYQPDATEFNTKTLKLYFTSTHNRVCKAVKDSVVYTLQKNPDEATVVGTTICSTTAQAILTLAGTETGVTYQAYLGNTTANPLGTAVVGPSSQITVTNAAPLVTGDNLVSIRASVLGCSTRLMLDTANVRINPDPNTGLAVSANPKNICSGGATSITIINSEKNVRYELFDGNLSLTTAIGTGSNMVMGPFVLSTIGLHVFSVKASIAGCTTKPLTDTAGVQVDQGINTNLNINYLTPVCSTSGNPSVTLVATELGVSYDIYEGLTKLNTASLLGNGLNQSFSLNLGVGIHTLTIKAKNAGCGQVQLLKEPVITVNAPANADAISISANKQALCQGSPLVVTVNPTKAATYTYTLLNGNTVLGVKSGANGPLVFDPVVLGVGTHFFSVEESIPSCTKDTTTKLKVVVDSLTRTNPTLKASADTICESGQASFTLGNAQKDVTYILYDNGSVRAAQAAPTNSATLVFGPFTFTEGDHLLSLKAKSAGCDTVNITATAKLRMNGAPKASLLTVKTSETQICANEPISVNVSPTRSALYQYTLLDNGVFKAIQKGNNGLITFNPVTLGVGVHQLRVLETVKGCAGDTTGAVQVLVDSLTRTNPGLLASADTICESGQASFTLSNAQKDVTYTLFDNGAIRATQIATIEGATLVFGPFTFAEGDHLLSLKAKSTGCDTVNITATAKLRVNGSPKASALNVTPSNTKICGNEPFGVSVKTSRSPLYQYTLFDNGVFKSTQNGNNGTLLFNSIVLSDGTHQLRVVETVQGCANDTTAEVSVEVYPAIDSLGPLLKVSDAVSCTDTAITVDLLKAQKGITYTLFRNNVAMLPVLTAVHTGDTLHFGKFGNMSAGKYLFTVLASNAGCKSVNLRSTDSLLVNKKPDKDISVIDNSPICIHSDNSGNSSVVLAIQKEAEVSYSVYRGKFMKDSLLGTTTDMTFTAGPYYEAGFDTLIVVANREGCRSVVLDSIQYVTINKYPNLKLSSVGDTICFPSDAAVKLLQTDSSVSYIAQVRSTAAITQKGGGDLGFALPQNILQKGVNEVVFRVSVAGCGNRQVGVDTVLAIGDTAVLTGDTIVCEGAITTYTIQPVLGARKYTFTVPTGAGYVQNGNSITVTWGDSASSGVVSVVPDIAGTLCDRIAARLNVRVYQAFKGQALLTGKDTLCVGERDTLSIEGILGLADYTLDKVDGVDMVEVSKTQHQHKQYAVHYTKVGTFVYTYHLINPCRSKDSILTKTVVVLPQAVASVGTYPVLEMKYFPREVVLDGSASSKGPFTYKWYTKPAIQINNQTSMMASFVPEQTKQTVYLLVANKYKGMCPSLDSTSIFVDLGIFIPNAFTPNNDGDHDTWLLENVNAFYPNVGVDIYSKWGTLIYHSEGYATPWDGTKNGEEVPAATYYFVIDLKRPNFKPIAGSVTIIR